MRLSRPIAVILVACLAVGSGAAKPKLSPEEQLARFTRGATPGRTTSCINLPQARDSQTIDGLGIVYKIGGTFYLNRFQQGCSLTSFDTLVTSTPSTQLCRGDIARIYDATTRIPKGSCVFDDFQTYQRPRAQPR